MEKNIALIGAGYWGKNHLRNLYQLGVLHSVLEVDNQTIEERKAQFPDINYIQDESSLLNNPEVQAVIIATPAKTHYELAKKSLSAGMHVLVEKPLSLTLPQGQELVELAQEKKKVLMVGHILHYHPAVIKLKELIDNGELGDLRYVYSNRLNIGKLRKEENVLWSFAPHDISLILMLLNGLEPQQVDAHGGAYIKPGIYDTTLTTLEFKNGVKGHIFVNWLHPFKEQKLVVVGSKKMAVFDDIAEEKLLIYPHRIDFIDGSIPIAHKAESYPVNFEMREPLKEEILHFIHCISTGEIPKTDGQEALKVLGVLNRAESKLGNNIKI